MQTWIVLVIIYGLLRGIREPIKKAAMSKTDLLTTLFLYTFIGFLFSIPFSLDAFEIPPKYLLYITLKSAVLFAAWTASFGSIKKLPISLYGVIDLSRVLFSTLLGMFVLGEVLTSRIIVGLVLVCLGLFLANLKNKGENTKVQLKYVFLALLSCLFNACSGTLDKFIMKSGQVSSSQLQFWFMLILSVMYFLYILLSKKRIELKNGLKNPYIYVISALLIFGDRLLFIANSDPESRVTIITIINQCSVIVAIAAGRVFFKEKNILYRSACAAVVIAGVLTVILK